MTFNYDYSKGLNDARYPYEVFLNRFLKDVSDLK